jgi:hypothetical protein
MRLSVLSVTIMMLIAGCAAASPVSLEDRTLSFGCDDIVVVGSIVNGAYQPTEADNDVIGHGWISATVKVRHVIRGTRIPSVVPVKYFAHAYMREGQDFMLVLERADAGYEIATGQLMSLHPRLASRCG